MSEPIRVLHVLQRMEAAGVQTLLMSIYRQIDRSKIQFDFLVHYETPQFFDQEIEELGGHIYRLSFREDYNFVKYVRDLDKFFKSHTEYKVIHGHMHSLGAIYLYMAKRNHVPVRIAHSHTNNTQKDEKKCLKLFMNSLYDKFATDLFACSYEAGRYMFGEKNFKVINNAIDSEKFLFSKNKREEKRKELAVENYFVVGNVGRFELQKNQTFTIDVFEKLHEYQKDAMLLLIGSGSMEEEIKEKVYKKGLKEKVLFLGNRNDVAELYQAMDVFLMPSLFEGLGIVGVEAQAAGTPIVCTDTLPEEINVTPLIYRMSLNCSAEQWAKEILKARDNKETHKDMREYIINANYDIRNLSEMLENFYVDKNKTIV